MKVISIFRENKQKEKDEGSLVAGMLWLMVGLTLVIIAIWEVQTHLTNNYPTLGEVIINNFK